MVFLLEKLLKPWIEYTSYLRFWWLTIAQICCWDIEHDGILVIIFLHNGFLLIHTAMWLHPLPFCLFNQSHSSLAAVLSPGCKLGPWRNLFFCETIPHGSVFTVWFPAKKIPHKTAKDTETSRADSTCHIRGFIQLLSMDQLLHVKLMRSSSFDYWFFFFLNWPFCPILVGKKTITIPDKRGNFLCK